MRLKFIRLVITQSTVQTHYFITIVIIIVIALTSGFPCLYRFDEFTEADFVWPATLPVANSRLFQRKLILARHGFAEYRHILT